MRLKITLLFAFVMLAVTNTYAGFPVERATTSLENTFNLEEDADAEVLTSPAAAELDKQTTAILLWALLGGFAAHRWYLGSPIGWNILFILTAGFFIVGWVIDGIEIITGTYPGL